jgi:pilus assembly protein CpaF
VDDLRHKVDGSEERRRLKAQLHHQLITSMDLSALGSIGQEQLRAEIRRMAEELCKRSASLLSRADRDRLIAEVLDETFGLGPLEELLRDPTVSDILINGHDTVYVERNGRLERTEVGFSDARHLLHIVQRIVGQIGRHVDETSPMVDGRLPDGSRINAIIPPSPWTGPWSPSAVSAPGPCRPPTWWPGGR